MCSSSQHNKVVSSLSTVTDGETEAQRVMKLLTGSYSYVYQSQETDLDSRNFDPNPHTCIPNKMLTRVTTHGLTRGYDLLFKAWVSGELDEPNGSW